MWHCMIYRKALQKAPLGIQMLRETLEETHTDDEQRCCVLCEEDTLSAKLLQLGLKEVSCKILL